MVWFFLVVGVLGNFISEVHLWCLFPDDVRDPKLMNMYQKLLSSDEQEKVLESSCVKTQNERLLARTLVRTTLARCKAGSYLFCATVSSLCCRLPLACVWWELLFRFQLNPLWTCLNRCAYLGFQAIFRWELIPSLHGRWNGGPFISQILHKQVWEAKGKHSLAYSFLLTFFLFTISVRALAYRLRPYSSLSRVHMSFLRVGMAFFTEKPYYWPSIWWPGLLACTSGRQ